MKVIYIAHSKTTAHRSRFRLSLSCRLFRLWGVRGVGWSRYLPRLSLIDRGYFLIINLLLN